MKKVPYQRSWRDHCCMSVVGCIDSQGAIIARPCKQMEAHTAAESKGKRWRWMIWSQEFIQIGPIKLDELNDEEVFAVWDWLRKNGFTDDRTMPQLTIDD